MIQSRQSSTTVLMTMNSPFDNERTLYSSPCVRGFAGRNLFGIGLGLRPCPIRQTRNCILDCTAFGRGSATHTYPLFPDLLENQKKSVRRFWSHGLPEEFELFSYASGKKKHLHMIFHGTKFFLEKSISSLGSSSQACRGEGGLTVSADAGLYSMESSMKFPRKAKSTQQPIQRILEEQKTYSVSLFLPIEFQWLESGVQDVDYGIDLAQDSERVLLRKAEKKPNTDESSNGQNTYSNSTFREVNTGSMGVTHAPLQNHGSVFAGSSRRICTVPIYFGEIPLMTERGSFFINGSARVLVNQIVRCPSIYFKVKIDQKNRRTYIGSFLSEYGSWLRLETDYKNRIWVRIDKSQRISIYALLRSLGFPERFLEYQCKHYPFLFASREEYFCDEPHEAIQYIWKKLTPGRWNSLQGCYTFLYNKFFHPRRYSIGKIGRLQLNKRFSRRTNMDIRETGLSEAPGNKVWNRVSNEFAKRKQQNIELNIKHEAQSIPTLTPEDIFMAMETLIDFHYGEGLLDDIDHLKNRRVRLPGELMQNQLRLALSRVTQTATEKLSKFELDEFAERGEAGNEYEINDRTESIRAGFAHVEPSNPSRGPTNQQFREANTAARKQNMQSIKDCIQTQVFGSAFRELFNTSQLSQYMDQTNPLAEITHKRRLSSLGPGGIGRDQAGFAVREIHPSHFGRICPIETPEGQNAGLVGSLATYSRITSDGFLQSPYYQSVRNPILNGRISKSSIESSMESTKGRTQHRTEHRTQDQTQTQTRNDWFFFSADIEDESYISSECLGFVGIENGMQYGRSPIIYSTSNSIRAVREGSVVSSLTKVNIEYTTLNIPEAKTLHTHKKIEKYPIRYKQEFFSVDKNQIQFFGVSPIQMISLATSLIPFLEHDDANRALMGSNMQRQAVPLLFAEKPFIGTGLESQAARDSSTCLLAKKSGQVLSVNGFQIDVLSSSYESSMEKQDMGHKLLSPTQHRTAFRTRALYGRSLATEKDSSRSEALGVETYLLQKYWRSNQNTCLRQTPRVRLGEWVEKGDLLADGSATLNGEVALGKNIFVAYMPWEGYNFEDAIVINERLVQEDIYTSIHIDRYDVETRDTEHGKERITRDVRFLSFGNMQGQSPQRSSRSVVNGIESEKNRVSNSAKLDSSPLEGQNPGELTESPMELNGGSGSAERLYRSEADGIEFDAGNVEGMGEAPAHINSHSIPNSNADGLLGEARSTGEYNSAEQSFEYLDTRGIIFPGTWVEEGDILVGKLTPISPPKPTPEYRLLLAIFETKPLPFKDTSLRVPSGIEGRVLECVCTGEAAHTGEVTEQSSVVNAYSVVQGSGVSSLTNVNTENAMGKARAPYLAAGSIGRDSRTKIEKVHVFLVHKRKIQLGDKMSGRHGNKGIVSLILPPQDMPFLQDGTPVDIVLNPLGVPSRMNVGQVLECLFGFATKYLKQNYRLCAFDEMYGTDDAPDASRGLVYTKLYEAACQTGYQWLFDPNHPGKSHLFDGRTGEAFHQPVLVGYSYMFKLIHLVDEKMHARSTGPYSLVTQQPLGGRSKHGGQRLGEMEVWALEGFGAAAVLHEFLTLKSDDIDARNTFLFHLMKRRHFPPERLRRCLPESFRVLVHELQSLCLSVYYNPDFRLTYPSLLGWDGLFLLSSKKLPTLDQLGQLKIA